ncbi:hypothetical protein [Fodinibius salsisoli]|uniref:Uncharacterized protein n=1 Tax=Fodinibius salsisoli TaxID=2820877 RepID=A0ABT3PI41_9BACT|nr:hypothetical protein [Fodinibius salsisoli]MCW9705592.1 hypothetical protein [Fodinibius salsisoli]
MFLFFRLLSWHNPESFRDQQSWKKSQEEFNSSVLTDFIAADNGLQAAPGQTEILPVGGRPFDTFLERPIN